MKAFSTLTLTVVSFVAAISVPAVSSKKVGIMMLKKPAGVEPDKPLTPEMYSTFEVILTASQQEFLTDIAPSSTQSTDVFDGNRTRSLLRGNNRHDEHRDLQACPPIMSCPKCVSSTRWPDIFCWTCPSDNCGRRQQRSLVEQLFPFKSRSLQESDSSSSIVTTTTTNPMAGLKNCEKARPRDLQDGISNEAKKERLNKFAPGFDRSSVRLYICEDDE
jgi:hypothetical protein